MVARHRRFDAEEFARRGDEIFEGDIRPKLRGDDDDKIVAIDIESRNWEIDVGEVAACERLQARRKDTQIWFVRVGSRCVRRFCASR